MGTNVKERLSPKEAVDAAFEHFRELYAERQFKHLLLEGISFNSLYDSWDVTIGFDIGRKKTSGGQMSLFGGEQEPLREFRLLRVGANDGAFLGMEAV